MEVIGNILWKLPETITRQTIQGRGEEEGHGTPGQETRKGKHKGWDTSRETWRGQTDRQQWYSVVNGLMFPACKQAYVK